MAIFLFKAFHYLVIAYILKCNTQLRPQGKMVCRVFIKSMDAGSNVNSKLNLGFIILTFGLKIQISIASVIGVLISMIIYRFIK